MKGMFKLLAVKVLVLSLAACADEEDRLGVADDGAVDAPAARDSAVEPSDPIAMNVYTSPTCGCCGLWVEHAEQRGFKLSTHYPADLSLFKFEQGIKPELQSCHTAVSAEGYLFEGHVPARYMLEFLANPPAGARGLAVPAMPVGSPGMEVGDRFTPYEVLLLSEDGGTEVFARVTEPEQQYVTY